MIRRLLNIVTLSMAVLGAATARAQCEPMWFKGDDGPLFALDLRDSEGVRASVLWDPDGAGPQTEVVVVGGSFEGVLPGSRSMAVYDPSAGRWSTLDNGLTGAVYALAVLSDGRLVAGGSPGIVAEDPSSLVAIWNGTTWSSLGLHSLLTEPSTNYCSELAALSDGRLVAVGNFSFGTLEDGGTALAVWNGATWSRLGNAFPREESPDPFTPPRGTCVTQMPNGDIIVGGIFQEVAGRPIECLARWNGTEWSSMGFLQAVGHSPTVLFCDSRGDLVVYANSSRRVVRWNGAVWSTLLHVSQNRTVRTIAELPNGDLVFGGDFASAAVFPNPSVSAKNIIRWNGSTLTRLAEGTDRQVYGLHVLSDGTLAVTGTFNTAGTETSRGLALWKNDTWVPPTSGFNRSISALILDTNGTPVAGGGFTRTRDGPIQYVAQWNGSAWSPMGAGLNAGVGAFIKLPNGELIAGGSFTASGFTSMKSVARWDGSTWSAIGPDLPVSISSLAVLPSGLFVAAGGRVNNDPVRVYQWNGTGWWTYGTGMTGGFVSTLLALPNGHVIAGGSFTAADSTPAFGAALWDHSKWTPLGSGMLWNGDPGRVSDLILETDGTVLAAGFFNTAGGVPANCIARWNGVSWEPVGKYPDLSWGIDDITILANGRLLAASRSGVWEWDGAAWSVFAEIAGGSAVDLEVAPDGTLFAAGSFVRLGNQANANFARFGVDPTCCPADLDRDDLVNDNDFSLFVVAYDLLDCDDPAMPAPCAADLDHSRRVDDHDFTLFIVAYDNVLCP